MTKPIETWIEPKRIDKFRFSDINLHFTEEIEKIEQLIRDNSGFLYDYDIEDFRKMKSDLETIYYNLPNYFEDIESNIGFNKRTLTDW